MLIEAHRAKVPDETYVASFSMRQRKDSEAIRSYLVWSNSVATLLPVTELVVLMSPKTARHYLRPGSRFGKSLAT